MSEKGDSVSATVYGTTGQIWLIAPYAAWMVMMMVMPPTAGWYALRAAVTAVLLVGAFIRCSITPQVFSWRNAAIGVEIGFAVFALWILPEQFDWAWYQRFCVIGEGGTKAIAESGAWMVAARLFGSAFIIAVAEELFFRRWLIGFAGFWWMVALFAVEHDRWAVGAAAGAVYGAVYLRRGIFAAVSAHITTNFALGIWVILTGQWQFW